MVTNYTDPSIYEPFGITAGPDGALWFTNYPTSIGRISPAGVVTNYTGTGISLPEGIMSGADGARWFTNYANNSIGRISTADSVSTSVTLGPSGTAMTLKGAGFTSGEKVTVKFLTGLSSKARLSLCTATARPDGTFACNTAIPATAGKPGSHVIEAKGKTSKVTAKTFFLLTKT